MTSKTDIRISDVFKQLDLKAIIPQVAKNSVHTVQSYSETNQSSELKTSVQEPDKLTYRISATNRFFARKPLFGKPQLTVRRTSYSDVGRILSIAVFPGFRTKFFFAKRRFVIEIC